MSLMLIHEISAAEIKKWGAENKIGHSILSNERQSLSFFLHRGGGGGGGGGEGSAVKRMKCPNPTGYVPCSFF